MSALLARSLTGGVLIAVLLLLRLALQDRLPKGTFRALWIVTLLHLLLPRLPYSPLSLYNFGKETAGSRAEVIAAQVRSEVLTEMVGKPVEVAGAAREAGLPVLFWIWVIGVLLCGGWFLIGYMRSLRRFRRAEPMEPQVYRGIRLRQSTEVRTPLAYGLLRPTILLPETFDGLAEETANCVLLHEQLHIRRGDLWLKAGLVLAACIYWFSPMSWLMLCVSERDIELACDAAVLRRLGIDRRRSYAMALIRMEEQKPQASALASGFAGNALEARITTIMKTRKTTKAALAAAIALCLCVTVVFAATGERVAKPTIKEPQRTEEQQKFEALKKELLTEEKTELEPEEEIQAEIDPSELPPVPEPVAVAVWTWPVPSSNNITGRFGARIHPITGEKMVYDHITVAASKDILAAQSGKVMEVGFDAERGNYVAIDHGNGFVTAYAHLAESIVHVGQYVEGGAVIGTAGHTGTATGDCLAFWVYENGTSVDPLQFYNIEAPKFVEGAEIEGEQMVSLPDSIDEMLANEAMIQYFAYMDINEAENEIKPLIEAARKYIIYQYTWVDDELSAEVRDQDGNVKMAAPKFHDIFPEDWEIPLVTE